jgi:acyl transferase domain-containing protein
MTAPDPMRSLLEQATRELRRLRAENERLTARSGPVAVVGLGCRFPGGANDPESFWRLLDAGADAIREVPADRWPRSPDEAPGARFAGLLDVPLTDFDADFFALSGRELESLDPQQRLLLEVAWEALEHGGLALDRLRSRVAGVFVGLANLDYRERVDAHPPDVYSATGNLHSTAAGRISYALDLHGPSVAVDTACSSSLVAVHLAIGSLQRGECELALAGGVQLLLSPRTMHKVATTLGLAPDGKCRAFDARAQGLVRAEGCGVVVLKRLADARRDGDPILAVLRGSAINHNGATLGMTAPSPLAQERLLRAALADAGLTPAQVGCIEAMGAGSPLGDAIEIEALHAVYGAPRQGGSRCAVASLKTNLGHMEAASGIGGLIKIILALAHERIPAHRNLERLHPQIRLDASALTIPTHSQPWPRSTTPRIAGISAFGISGTNAHVLVEEPPPAPTTTTPDDGRVVLLPISARSPSALQALLAHHRSALTTLERQQTAATSTTVTPTVSLPDLAHALALHRTHGPYRRALIGRTHADLLAALETSPPPSPARGRPQIVFVCPDHGEGWPALATALLAEEPAFHAALHACEAALRPLTTIPLAEQLHTIPLAAPTLWALELALAAVWRARGIEPDAIVGRGVGELAAAHLAGVLSLEQAVRILAARERGTHDDLADIIPQPPKYPLHGATPRDLRGWLRDDRPSLRELLRPLAAADTVFINLGSTDATDLCLRSITPGDEPLALHRALAALYEAGHPVTWAQPDPQRRRVPLPTYPWQRDRYWIDLPSTPALDLPTDTAAPALDPTTDTPAPALDLTTDTPAIAASFTSPRHPPADPHEHTRPAPAIDARPGNHTRPAPPIDASPRPAPAADLLRELVWRPAPLPSASTAARPTAIWLAAIDAADGHHLIRALANLGHTPSIALRTLDEAPTGPIDAIVVLLADTLPAMPALAASRTTQRIWTLIRAVLQRGDRDPPRLVLITRGATDGANLEHAPVWGLARTVMHEHPGLRCTLIDCEPGVPLPAAQLAHELLGPDREDQLAYRNAGRHGLRLAPVTPTQPGQPAGDRPFRLEQDTPGVLAGLTLRAHPRGPLAAGAVEIAVEFAGLNFLDVLRALAVMPDDGPLGAECVGTITALADDIHDLRLGDRVIALADGALGTHVQTPRALVVPLPAGLDPAAAATLPITTLTAWQALHHVARLQPGERVLIHAAAGGVGHAAVQIALARGAIVFGTAGTAAKRALLTAQGVHHVASSRDRSFVDVFRAATDGEGVDVVLNCLAGDLLDASVELLRDDGRFIEIGKRDYLADRPIGLAPFLRRLTWSLVDLRGMMREPSRLRPLLDELGALWSAGAVRPLPHTLVPIADVTTAFAAMARGEHTGKLVIDLRRDPTAHEPTEPVAAPSVTAHVTPPREPTVLIAPARAAPLRHARGTVLLTRPDALALQLVHTLLDRGAAHVLIHDPDAELPADHPVLQALEHRASVRIHRGALATLTPDAPIVAVLHTPAAAPSLPLLAPAPALEPILREALELDDLCAAHPLEHLILCTRTTATLGAAGHAADAAIDTFLAALAHQRRARGLPALCIEWDDSLTPDERGLAFAELLTRDPVHALAMRLHLRRWRESNLTRARAPLLADLPDDDVRAPSTLRAQVLALDLDARREAVQTHLLAQVAGVLRRPAERLGLDRPLQQCGLDSLMALELRNRLEASLTVALSPTVIWRHPSIRSLTQHLLELLGEAGPAPSSVPDPSSPPEPSAAPADDVAGIARFLAEVAALAGATP